jgi:hypothetical protein
LGAPTDGQHWSGDPAPVDGQHWAGDPLTALIKLHNVLDRLDSVLWKFLHGTGSTVPPDGAAGTFSGSPDNPDHREHLGLPPTPTGGQLMADLTNIGKLLDVPGHGSNDPGGGSGHPTTPHAGYASGAFGNPDNGGKPEFKELMSHNHTIVPKH